MPKLPRVTVVQFGSGGPSTDFGQFGSKAASAPQTSQNPAVLQALMAWLNGWAFAAVGADFNPFLEDMNCVAFVFGYFIANLFERGIPDWDAGTTYYKGAVVNDPAGSGQVWSSLQDNNLNNTPPLSASNAFWQWTNPPVNAVGSQTVNTIPKVTSTSPAGGVAGSRQLGDSAISDNGTNVILSEPLQFPDGSIQSKAAQPQVSNQNVVTGSRALNTIFHNTGLKPLFVSISVNLSANGTASVKTDSTSAPSTVVQEVVLTSGPTQYTHNTVILFFIVLPGNYYEVVTTGTVIAGPIWTEWS